MKYGFLELCQLPDRKLDELFTAGARPTLDELAGWEFDGYNTADGSFVLGIRRFRKGFLADDPLVDAGEIGGYNVTVRQDKPTRQWEPVVKKGVEHHHSPFRVYVPGPDDKDGLFPNAVLINYDCKRKSLATPFFLRDYLVRVYPDDDTLYLGKAYAKLGPVRVYAGYFVARRAKRVTSNE